MHSQIDTAIENLALLRATEHTNPELGETLEPVIEQLCELVGATVSRATAARLLGVSQPALDRWIDLREIASVLTPTGRRAVPTEHLVELLDDVRQARKNGHQRALKAVIVERRRLAATLETDEILEGGELASLGEGGHRRAELVSLAYHRVVARQLDSCSVRRARRRLRQWEAAGKMPIRQATAWWTLLNSSSQAELVSVLTTDSQESRDLRQNTPFAAALSEQQRARLRELIHEGAPANQLVA